MASTVGIGLATRFTAENQPKKRGRKPSKLKGLIKKYDLPKQDVDAIIQNLLFDHTVGELEKIASDDEKKSALPAFAAYLMVLLEKSTAKGDIRPFSYLLDRVYGKPTQVLDVHQPDDDKLPKSLSELMELEKVLDARAKELDGPESTGKAATQAGQGNNTTPQLH
jgi:hypothetical protein